mmetsp:Transcript_25612/g.55348  ORF Transcript_25612/g.55348 Transcript_25612/m.55348 type:complete len:192 (+) Transcript_25612:1261-1836(+)
MKLRTKKGWAVLVAQEANGRRLVYDPLYDDNFSRDQKAKGTVRPHAFLLYMTMLTRMHMRAGRNLTSLTVLSCYALNERPAAPLYDPTANLLEYLGKYELIAPFGMRTAVGRWLAEMPLHTDQPKCDRKKDYHDLAGRSAVAPYRQLYRDAGLVKQANGHLYVGSSGEPAYTQGFHRMDAQLATYVAKQTS